jgi:signal transduction histidine kinase
LDGGNPAWLEELNRLKPNFNRQLRLAKDVARSDWQRESLARIETACLVYDTTRSEVVEMYQQRDVGGATVIQLTEIRDLGDEAQALCEEFLINNERAIGDRSHAAQNEVQRLALLVGSCVLLTIGTGAVLGWQFFTNILKPVRSMAAEARGFANEDYVDTTEMPEDELSTVGHYLRALMSDVSEARSDLQRSRRQLISAEKLAAAGKIAASVAHEIRNPLTSMKMWLSSLRRSASDNADMQHKFDIVSEEISRLEEIIHSFLEFARPPAPRLSVHNVSSIIDATLELLHQNLEVRRIRLMRADDTTLLPVMADPDQLRQVLINLFNNSIEAMPSGGELKVSVECVPLFDGRPAVVVRVSDSGCGMPADVQAHVFEPFFTTKDDGTGLGLSIGARIMALLNGRLVLDSSTNKGTTFSVWIPVAVGYSGEYPVRVD